jgi:hypothetical protein
MMIPDFSAPEATPSAEEEKQVYRDRLNLGDLYLLEHDGEILWVEYGSPTPALILPAEPQIVKALLDEGFLVASPAKNGARAYELASKIRAKPQGVAG